MKVVVVGAGPAGLISLRSLQKEFSGDKDVEFVCYERKAELGGEWVFTGADYPEIFDKDGYTMKTSVYRGLRMNTPTLICQPHPDHAFPPGTSLYPSMEQMYRYFRDFADKFSLEKYIHYNKMISEISYDKATSKFHMNVVDSLDGSTTEEECDYLLMCVGQYREPRLPDGVDFSQFSGETFHYHHLADPARLFGKRLLVVGGSWGAMDMVIMFNRPNRAASVDLSWHTMPPFWMRSVKNVPMHSRVTSANGNTVSFADGSSVDVDVVIFASGFKQSHPLSEELQLDFNASRFLFPLYKHLVHPKCPRLFFPGKGNVLILCTMRPQTEFACKVMKGSVKLPSEKDMLSDIAEFQTYWLDQLMRINEFDPTKYFPVIELEYAQGDAVVKLAGLEPMQPGDCFVHLMYQIWKGVLADVMNYKDYQVKYRRDEMSPGSQILPFLVPRVPSEQ